MMDRIIEALKICTADLMDWTKGIGNYIDFDPKFGWSTLVQIAGFAITILTVWMQLTKQRKLQDDIHRVGLQLNTYENITSKFESCSPTGVASRLSTIPALIRIAETRAVDKGIYLAPPISVDEINNSYKAVHANLYHGLATIEKYEIVLPNLSLFRRVLMKKTGELSDAYMPIIMDLPYILLSEDSGIQDPKGLKRLCESEIQDIEIRIDTFQNAAFDVAAFLHDIQVELQNELLGSHFDRLLPIRITSNSTQIVLTSSDEVMLNRARNYLDA